jgi:hypothetical protein
MLPIEALEQAEFELNLMVSQSGLELSMSKDKHLRNEMSEPLLAQAFAAHSTWKHAHAIVKEQLDNTKVWR